MTHWGMIYVWFIWQTYRDWKQWTELLGLQCSREQWMEVSLHSYNVNSIVSLQWQCVLTLHTPNTIQKKSVRHSKKCHCHLCHRRLFIIYFNIFFTFTIWSCKYQVSSVARALFNLCAHCRTMLSLFSQKELHLKGQRWPIHLNQVNWIKPAFPKPSFWDSANTNRTLHFPACMHKQKTDKIKTLCIQLGITQSNFYILPSKISWKWKNDWIARSARYLQYPICGKILA
jgi:hypothetical protein